MPKYDYLYRLVGAIAISCATASLALATVSRWSTGSEGSEGSEANQGWDLLAISRQADPFREAVSQAVRAASLSQNAFSPADWNQVAMAWIEAVAWMQSVPPNSPKRIFAEKKVREYLENFTYARQRAAGGFGLSYPTFNSEILDRQLELYLSYIAAVGTPDVAIVGSSRALQGLDPSALQQALAARGYPGLKIFNFGVNGATAQVVNFILDRLLSTDQLPRMIIWADGVRAFNNGRSDRTYNEIVSSPGYQRLISGIRPSLTSGLSETSISLLSPGQNLYSYQPVLSDMDSDFGELIDPTILAQGGLNRSPFDAIDANGFKAVSARFNPSVYYRQNRRVSGNYDGDYAAFQLGGNQDAALRSVVALTKARKIPLLVVNLPLTYDYLDNTRSYRQQQFRQYMQSQARSLGFVWRDYSQGDISRNEYFEDPSHLNRFGAAAVARQLAADRYLRWPQRQ